MDLLKEKYKETVFIRTEGGYISRDLRNWGNYFELEVLRNGLHITIHNIKEGWTKINMVCKEGDEEEKKIVWGKEALREWIRKFPQLKKEICFDKEKTTEAKINDRKWYHLDMWPEAFQGIPETSLKWCGKNLEHVYSIDFHSAFPAALSRIRPDMREGIEDWYLRRKNNERIKGYLNNGIGAMASERVGLQILGVSNGLALLRSEVLEDHAALMNYMVNLLWKRGCIILNMRTDSIKFMCFDEEKLKDLPFQGDGLGQWHYEFKNTKYRQFSTGKYEYINDEGKVEIVMNGLTKLDKIKDRSEWDWDDLEKCGDAVTWNFDKDKWRIIYNEKKESNE